jgi:hypothetical protein
MRKSYFQEGKQVWEPENKLASDKGNYLVAISIKMYNYSWKPFYNPNLSLMIPFNFMKYLNSHFFFWLKSPILYLLHVPLYSIPMPCTWFVGSLTPAPPGMNLRDWLLSTWEGLYWVTGGNWGHPKCEQVFPPVLPPPSIHVKGAFFFFGGTVWTQGFTLVRQTLY